MSKDAKLLPCPFCGCAIVYVVEDEFSADVEIYCSKCGATFQESFPRRVMAAKKWNKRWEVKDPKACKHFKCCGKFVSIKETEKGCMVDTGLAIACCPCAAFERAKEK